VFLTLMKTLQTVGMQCFSLGSYKFFRKFSFVSVDGSGDFAVD